MLTGTFSKFMWSQCLNIVMAYFLWITIPEYVSTFGSSCFWGALGGLVRMLVDAKAKGKSGVSQILGDGWSCIVIGALSGAALEQVHIIRVDDYVKDLPINAIDFLIGNFAVNIYATGDKMLRVAPDLIARFMPAKEEKP